MIEFKDPKMNDLLDMYRREVVSKEREKINEMKQNLEHKIERIIQNEIEKLDTMKYLQKLLMGEFDFNKQLHIKKSISNVCELIINLNNIIDRYKVEINELKHEFENLDKSFIQFEKIADFVHTIMINKNHAKYFKTLSKYINMSFIGLTKTINNKTIEYSQHCLFEDDSTLAIVFKINIHPNIEIDELQLDNVKTSKNEKEELYPLVFRLNKINLKWECIDPITNEFKTHYNLSYLIKWSIKRLEEKILMEKGE